VAAAAAANESDDEELEDDDSNVINDIGEDDDDVTFSAEMQAEYELLAQQEFPAEVVILHASLHVSRAKRQRDYTSAHIAESKETANNEWEERR
jgi:hypothetical protein